jgi:hypothetical protein
MIHTKINEILDTASEIEASEGGCSGCCDPHDGGCSGCGPGGSGGGVDD